MTAPAHVDLSGVNPTEEFVGRDEELATIQTQLAVDDSPWRAVNLYGAEGVGKTALALNFIEQVADSFDAIKYLPLSRTSSAQEVLDWLAGFLLNNEKQLKSKQVSKFNETKDSQPELADKIAPLIKLLTLRKVLVVFDEYQPDASSDVPQLLTMLIDTIGGPSRFIVISTVEAGLSLNDEAASSMGYLALEPLNQPVETTTEMETDIMADETPAEEVVEEEVAVAETTEEVVAEATAEPMAVEEEVAVAETAEEVVAEVTEEPVVEEVVVAEPPQEVAAPSAPKAQPEITEEEPQDAAGYLARGQRYVQQNNYQAAHQDYDKAFSAYKSAKDTAGLAHCTEAMGILCVMSMNYEEAQTHYEDALKYRQTLQDTAGVAEIYHQLTLLSQLQGDLAQARAYNQQSRQVLQREPQTT